MTIRVARSVARAATLASAPLLLSACIESKPPADSARRDSAPAVAPRGAVAPKPLASHQSGAVLILAAADTLVRWDATSALAGDVDCDGVADSAFVGKSPAEVHVGLVLGATKRPEILQFGANPGVQDAVCDVNAKLTFESIDYDDEDGMEGFERSAVCKGLRLDDGKCDAIHMYWNHRAQGLGWTRS